MELESAAHAPLTERSRDSFAVWADEYVRNESLAASRAGALRRLIASELRRMHGSGEQVLHATFAGSRWPGSDIENLLFNNIDQTLSLFKAAGRSGVRFEDLGREVPAAPDRGSHLVFYGYRLAGREEGFVSVEAENLLCRIPEVEVVDAPARVAARVWLAVRQARAEQCTGTAAGSYLLRMKTRGFLPGASVKALVDGVSAAMQNATATDELEECLWRLAAPLGMPASTLGDLTCPDQDAPLGIAARLFSLDGAREVRVTPDDDRCLAAEVLSLGDEAPAKVAAEVYRAKRA